MKILVFVDSLTVGGCQLNSIELACALRDLHGHEVVYFAAPGPMAKLIEQKRIRFVPAPAAHIYPSPKRMLALRKVVQEERPDIIHAWEWGQCVDAFYGVHIPMRVPVLVSHMMMDLTPLLPKRLPTTYGTPELRDQARRMGRCPAELLLPPVDIDLNAPNAVDPRPFRERYGIKDGEIVIVTVSRLDHELKSESLFRTLDAIRRLGSLLPVRFVIVGDGDIRFRLASLADSINAELERPVVVLAGELLDPRPAYAAADIVVGMGGSALRGMAFSKPVVIVGEKGFSLPLIPETAEWVYYKGCYGSGDGDPDNALLVENIRRFAEHPDELNLIGAFSRQFVAEHFSLRAVSAQLQQICYAVVDQIPQLDVVLFEGVRLATIGLLQGQLIPYWTMRNMYHRLGGPPILPVVRRLRRRLFTKERPATYWDPP